MPSELSCGRAVHSSRLILPQKQLFLNYQVTDMVSDLCLSLRPPHPLQQPSLASKQIPILDFRKADILRKTQGLLLCYHGSNSLLTYWTEVQLCDL